MDKELKVKLLTYSKTLLQKGWAKKTFARDNVGRSVEYFSSSAVSFCLYGALYRSICDVMGKAPFQTELITPQEPLGVKEAPLIVLQDLLREHLPPNTHLSSWNDTRESVEEVTGLLDKTIQGLG